jgi:hypothetical protein
VDRSLAGKPAEASRLWTAWYIKRRKLEQIGVERLLQEALREQGTYAGVTKTKIRRAASRLVASGVAK